MNVFKYIINELFSFYSPGCATDLSAIAQELPGNCKVSLALL